MAHDLLPALIGSLVEATCFEDAATGAGRDNPGAIARAAQGTLFIDEVDKLSLKAQAGLLTCSRSGATGRSATRRASAAPTCAPSSAPTRTCARPCATAASARICTMRRELDRVRELTEALGGEIDRDLVALLKEDVEAPSEGR